MATIVSTGLQSSEPVWLDTYNWYFGGVSDQWGLHVSSLASGEVDFTSKFDPYALASTPVPAFDGLSFTGSGFGAPDPFGFPTQGTVDTVTLTSSLNGMKLTFSDLDLSVGALLTAFRGGQTSDTVALLTAGNNVYEGSGADNNPHGFLISDEILGGDGADTIIGHGGRDGLRGGYGDDLFNLIDHTTPVANLGEGANVDGGPGVNTVTYADAPMAITQSLGDPQGSHDDLVNIQRLIGSAFGDSLTGAANADTITGGGGLDTIAGGAGDDQLIANGTASGADTHAVLFGGDGNDRIQGDVGFNQVNGNAGDDTVTGRSLTGDWLLGGQGNDRLDATASTGHNIVNGNLGADTLVGGAGCDSLRGGQGDDLVTGGPGGDWISGDLGNNTLIGAAGADTFHAGAGHDLVGSFDAAGGDRVVIGAGVHYSVEQTGADVTITLDNGGQMVLQDVSSTGFPAGWIAG